MDEKSRKRAGLYMAVGLGAFVAVVVFGGPYLLALDRERTKAPTGAVSVSGQQEPIGLRMRGEAFVDGRATRAGSTGPTVWEVCLGGYQFVQGDTSGRSATQILNEQGGGIKCTKGP